MSPDDSQRARMERQKQKQREKTELNCIADSWVKILNCEEEEGG